MDEEREMKRNKRKSFIKIIAIALSIIFAIFFNTFSWFTMNKDTQATGMTITTSCLPFQIATTGGSVRNQQKITELRPLYSQGEYSILENEYNQTSGYYTAANTDSLLLRFSPPSDDPATPDIDESIVPDIGPGSQGELNLYIIPKKSGSLDVCIDIDIICFTSVTSGLQKRTIEINDSLTTDSGLTTEEIAECKEAVKYLNGHIIFFEGLSNSQNYSYVKPITDGKIHFKKSDVIAGKAYKVPIYWTWANTFGQIGLKTNENDLREGTPVVEETANMGTAEAPTDKALILSYLKENKKTVFKNIDVYSNLTDAEKAEYDALGTNELKEQYKETKINNWIDSADTEKYFAILSEGYNTADFSIGSTLDYFMIELSVKNK